MTLPSLGQLMEFRHFPSVIHPRHARELLEAPQPDALQEWVGAYAITIPEHRHLLEDVLASLSWGKTGQAVVIHGLYGTGKSHCLVLLHLLMAQPECWSIFLEAHPTFRRYQRAMAAHSRLVVHFSLDEYSPSLPLDQVLHRSVVMAMQQAGIAIEDTWDDSASRLDLWTTLLQRSSAHGYDGVVLLIDELSLFLAGKSPARREADAGFLQFLAEMTGRAPLWCIGALQRRLSDVGALRTHSWRQVEDRFRRYALSPQAITNLLRDKLITRTNPEGIRDVVQRRIIPEAERCGIRISASDWLIHWPFNPQAILLIAELAMNYLSPHRSVMETLQPVPGHEAWLDQPATHLLTVLDLFQRLRDDLQQDERLLHLWQALTNVRHNISDAENTLLARLLDLLTIQYLAGRRLTVYQLQELLFDGENAPTIEELSKQLHILRRHAPHITVTREANPGAEIFTLELHDDLGVQAMARMREIARDLPIEDPRIVETVLQACTAIDWPLQSAFTEIHLAVPWHGSERTVSVRLVGSPELSHLAGAYEGIRGKQYDAAMLLHLPDFSKTLSSSLRLNVPADDAAASTLLQWLPRSLTPGEQMLWHEFACWQHTIHAIGTNDTSITQQLRRYCQQRADEMSSAITTSVRSVYLDGSCCNALGETIPILPRTSLAGTLSEMLAAGFARLFPFFSSIAQHGVPSPTIYRQLLNNFLVPGYAEIHPQSLLGEYIDRYAVPLGCVAYHDNGATVCAPCEEIVTVLSDVVAHGPVRIGDALHRLQEWPLGLTTEQGHIAITAAVRSGVLQGLDAFVHSLPPNDLSTNLAMLCAPEMVAEAWRSTIITLAETWQIPLAFWPLVCTQVRNRVQRILSQGSARLAQIHATIVRWSELAQTLPWAWKQSEMLLDKLSANDNLVSQSIDEIFSHFTPDPSACLMLLERLLDATAWWSACQPQFVTLQQAKLPFALHDRNAVILAQLATGEACLPDLATLQAKMISLCEDYSACYWTWHDGLFGMEVVSALRTVFNHANFRAVKALVALPLPVPETASRCLEALAQARAGYCHGSHTALTDTGCCPYCDLPYGSPSPLPDATTLNQYATSAIAAYAGLLAAHPWREELRTRAIHAPEDIVEKVHQLLSWDVTQGSSSLPDIIDERFISWLGRTQQVVGVRQVEQLQVRLAGKELTVSEVYTQLERWLDPTEELEKDAVLRFE